MRATTKAWSAGLLATALLFSLYLAVLTLSNSWSHAWAQYLLLAWWMTPLLLLFGLQASLFVYLRVALKRRHVAGAVATSGTISTGSMVACCLHHVTDVLPLLGLSAAVVFLNRYQEAFLLLGILSSLLGLAWMLKMAQEQGVAGTWLLRVSAKVSWSRIFPFLIFTAIFVLALKVFTIMRV